MTVKLDFAIVSQGDRDIALLLTPSIAVCQLGSVNLFRGEQLFVPSASTHPHIQTRLDASCEKKLFPVTVYVSQVVLTHIFNHRGYTRRLPAGGTYSASHEKNVKVSTGIGTYLIKLLNPYETRESHYATYRCSGCA